MNVLETTSDRETIIELVKRESKLLHDEKYQISKNVPYRLLSSFVRELGGNSALWDQRNRLIAYFKMIDKKRCLPYTIGSERGLNKTIIIDERWRQFIIDNIISIRGWIQMKKIKFLQARNPRVLFINFNLKMRNKEN